MRALSRRRQGWALGLVLAILVAGCATSQRLHSDAIRLSSEGKHEAALPLLREAQRLEPNNSEFRIDLLKEQQLYAAELLERGDEARAAGKPAEAAAQYQKALQIDPASERARRGLAALDADVRATRHVAESARLLRDGQVEAAREKANAALAENPRNEAAKRQLVLVQAQAEKLREANAAKQAAQSIMNRPVTLQFRDANLRMVFEALSRTTGLNVILDRDVRADLKTTIFVKDAALEDTVDLILLQNQLEKRSLNANTMFVYPATAAKQKEYQDLQVRTFQVANADVKYLQGLLKSVLKIKDISMDERSGTLVIRDTPEAMAVVAKVIAAHDLPESEVMLEVEVLEIAHDRLTNLGIEIPTAVSISTPPGVNGQLTLSELKALRVGNLLVSPLSVGINLKLQDTDANLLASPRIRARNKEKARILIGDRVPIITNTVTPVASGTGVVTGSVQYQDVGLKLEFEPQVYSDEEVGIRISLEVSTIVREIAGPNGSLAYQIGTRNAQTSVRLRDGETQILGGLISSTDRNTAARIPGVGQLPVVGRLFGNNAGTANKTEIILSITPHIIRPPAVVDASVREVFSGTENNIRQRALQLDPVGAVQSQSTGGPPGAPASTGRGSAAPVAPASPGVPLPPPRNVRPLSGNRSTSTLAQTPPPPVDAAASPTSTQPATPELSSVPQPIVDPSTTPPPPPEKTN